VIAPLVFFGLQIFNQARDLYIEVTQNETDLTTQLTQIGEERVATIFPELTVNVNEYIRQGASWLLQNLGSVFSSATQMVISFLLSLLALFYLLKDGPHFRKTIISLSPLLDRYDKTIFERLHNAVNSVVKGSLAIALLQGLSTGLGFTLFGVPQAALWGSVAVLSALIPNVGTALVITPAVIYLFLTDHLLASVGLAVWGVTAVGLIDNLLGPKLIQRGLQIHPLLILLAVLGGLSMFGPIGFLVGPIILSLLFALLDIYKVLILKDS
ncbi:MAG: AI-2E family transporter, partial [Candidatus Andersenbacteria bacterium]